MRWRGGIGEDAVERGRLVGSEGQRHGRLGVEARERIAQHRRVLEDRETAAGQSADHGVRVAHASREVRQGDRPSECLDGFEQLPLPAGPAEHGFAFGERRQLRGQPEKPLRLDGR